MILIKQAKGWDRISRVFWSKVKHGTEKQGQNQGGNERVLDMFRQDDNKIIVSEDTKTKITALGDVMEFQSKLNSALKQRYELLNTKFIINYNQQLPQVLQ